MKKRPPPPTDANIDALLVALNGDLRELDDESPDIEPEPEDAAKDAAALKRFLEEAGIVQSEDLGAEHIGAQVRAFRAAEAPATFAGRFGISTTDLAKLEAQTTAIDFSDVNAARALADATGVPILKVNRLLKAVASTRPSTSTSEPLLRAARKKPDDNDG